MVVSRGIFKYESLGTSLGRIGHMMMSMISGDDIRGMLVELDDLEWHFVIL